MRKLLETEQKALEINLDPLIYGTFAEIGAGQEVARYFFQVGAAAGIRWHKCSVRLSSSKSTQNITLPLVQRLQTRTNIRASPDAKLCTMYNENHKSFVGLGWFLKIKKLIFF